MDFETILKSIVATVAVVGMPIAGYAAVAATRAIWVKGEPGKVTPELEGHVAALEARVAELEAERDRLAEVEERVDFAERLLVRENQQPGIGPAK